MTAGVHQDGNGSDDNGDNDDDSSITCAIVTVTPVAIARVSGENPCGDYIREYIADRSNVQRTAFPSST